MIRKQDRSNLKALLTIPNITIKTGQDLIPTWDFMNC